MLLDDVLKDVNVIAGTGSRGFQGLVDIERNRILSDLRLYLVAEADKAQREQGIATVVMSGGALGWDAWLARAAMDVGLGVVFCIPNKGYGDYYWGKAGKGDNFYRMLSLGMFTEFTAEEVHNTKSLYVDGVHMNFLRNQRMVDLANSFVVYDPASRGTKDCVRRIEAAQKSYRVFA